MRDHEFHLDLETSNDAMKMMINIVMPPITVKKLGVWQKNNVPHKNANATSVALNNDKIIENNPWENICKTAGPPTANVIKYKHHIGTNLMKLQLENLVTHQK